MQFATDIFQETISLELLEFLEKWLMIYVDNFLLSTITKTEPLIARALEQLFQLQKALKSEKVKYVHIVTE